MSAIVDCCRLIWLHFHSRLTNDFHGMSDSAIVAWIGKQRDYVEFLQLYKRQCIEDLKQANEEQKHEAGELEVALGLLECRRLNRLDERSAG